MRAETQGVRPGDRDARVLLVRALADPRDDAPIVEADRQLRPELNAALDSFDDAHDVGRLAARRHEVEHARDRAVLRLPGRLEHKGVVEIAAPARRGCRRREQPATAVGAAEERSEAGARVEAGEAEPVDGAAAVDERRRLQVTEQRVVLDAGGHRFSISRPSSGQRFRTARLKKSSYVSDASSSSVRANRSRISASASVAVSTASLKSPYASSRSSRSASL